ncbi:MAG: methylated-DNA--[protein]-cysteine S-methyltransferase [Rikenellaceae bacterium]
MERCRAEYSIPGLGWCYIECRGDVVVSLQLSRGAETLCCGERTPFTDGIFAQVVEYLAGERLEFDAPLDMGHLTPFQQKVLRALQRIPYGEVCSYKQIAEAIGSPKAARAVGGACNRNPIHLIIPCHRIVGTNGSLTGYAAGVEIKEQLLEIEAL